MSYIRTAKENIFKELKTLLLTQYGLHLSTARKSAVGAGSDTWFLDCAEGKFVLKYPAAGGIGAGTMRVFAQKRYSGMRFCKKQSRRLYLCGQIRTCLHAPETFVRANIGLEFGSGNGFVGICGNVGQDPFRTAELSCSAGRNRDRFLCQHDAAACDGFLPRLFGNCHSARRFGNCR